VVTRAAFQNATKAEKISSSSRIYMSVLTCNMMLRCTSTNRLFHSVSSTQFCLVEMFRINSVCPEVPVPCTTLRGLLHAWEEGELSFCETSFPTKLHMTTPRHITSLGYTRTPSTTICKSGRSQTRSRACAKDRLAKWAHVATTRHNASRERDHNAMYDRMQFWKAGSGTSRFIRLV